MSSFFCVGFQSLGILGPGVSSLQPNTWGFYEALAQNPDELNSLAGFRTHIWDDVTKPNAVETGRSEDGWEHA